MTVIRRKFHGEPDTAEADMATAELEIALDIAHHRASVELAALLAETPDRTHLATEWIDRDWVIRTSAIRKGD